MEKLCTLLVREKCEKYGEGKVFIKEAEDGYKFALPLIGNEAQEVFLVALLNTLLEVIGYSEVYRGTLETCPIHPREIFRPAILANAFKIILFHNHPSGNPEPSRADFLITERLEKCGELLRIEVLDHIIVTHRGFYSFADNDHE